MEGQYSRTELLIGEEGMQKLKQAHVAVFGIGGVGGYVTEALARAGVGTLTLFDHDTVSVSNLNRQIIATRSTIGKYKVDVMKERILDINPNCKVEAHKCFYLPETKDDFDFSQYSYIVDAVDTVTAKIQLVMEAKEKGTPIISSMGAGNKLNPAEFEVADDFGKYHGFRCDFYDFINSLNGYVETDTPILTNINATEDEKNIIIELMRGGFYV